MSNQKIVSSERCRKAPSLHLSRPRNRAYPYRNKTAVYTTSRGRERVSSKAVPPKMSRMTEEAWIISSAELSHPPLAHQRRCSQSSMLRKYYNYKHEPPSHLGGEKRSFTEGIQTALQQYFHLEAMVALYSITPLLCCRSF
ncbi:hypothetical protein KC354_g139 [Hortaea werneckii]|nr:hypothetical protein KC354_g139 [Hortaea werneckii]